MKRQRNYTQSKEQEKSSERTNYETELTCLLDPKFKKVVIKMLTELRKIINRNTDHCNKELEAIKMNQSKIDNSGTSLVVQWLRILLPMQGTQVQALVREDPTCHRATKSVHHYYRAYTLEPTCHNY